MSELSKASEKIADKIAEVDKQITEVKSEAVRAAQLIAQMQLMAGKKKLKELQSLKSTLEEIQKETLKVEAIL